MMKSLSRFFVFAAFIYTSLATSSDIFFKCQNGVASEVKDKGDHKKLLQSFLKGSKKEQEEGIKQLCAGAIECEKSLRSIVAFANINQEVAEQYFQEQLAKVRKEEGITELENENAAMAMASDSYSKIIACEKTKTNFNPNDFVTRTDNLKIFYPNHTNYMYATGCGGVETKACSPMKKSQVDEVISESIAMGIDPYTVLAMNLMEGKAKQMGELYLDPIAQVDMLGCSAQRTGIGTESKRDNEIASYGTTFKVSGRVTENKDLGERMKKFMEVKGEKIKAESSYYCKRIGYNYNDMALASKPLENSCCMKLPFSFENNNWIDVNDNQSPINKALTYEFVRRKMNGGGYKGNNGPEWKMQSFNGFTSFFGYPEKVASFRAGLNFEKEPGYGNQAMDYILNSFMTNPYISKKVQEEMLKQKTYPKSAICDNRPDGVYRIDSNYYFNKTQNSKRLEVVFDKWKAGAKFSQLSKGQRSVMMDEMVRVSERPEFAAARLFNERSGETIDELQNSITTALGIRTYRQEAMAFEGASTRVYVNFHLSKLLYKGLEDFSVFKKRMSKNFQVSDDDLKTIYQAISDQYQSKDFFNSNKRIQVILSKLGLKERDLFGQVYKLRSEEEMTALMQEKPGWDQAKNNMLKLRNSLSYLNQPEDPEVAYQEYFRKYYPDNKTLGQSMQSIGFSGKTLTEDQAARLGSLVSDAP